MIFNFESLRIFAAIFVVMSHVTFITWPVINLFTSNNFFLGSIGVDIFFVLSGFVIRISSDNIAHLTKFKRIREFIFSRVFRIYPLYIILTLFYVFLKHIYYDTVYTLEEIVKSILLLPINSPPNYVDPILAPAWTLRFELYFYFLVGFSLFFKHRSLIIATLVVGSYIFGFFGYPYGANIIFEFLFGYLGLEICNFLKKKLGNQSLLLILISAISVLLASLGSDFSPSDNSIIPRMQIHYGELSFPRFIAWGLPCACLVWSAYIAENKVNLPLSSWGKYTYSVYLLQVFCIPVSITVAKNFGQFLGVVTLVVTISMTSLFFFRYIESWFIKVKSFLI